MSNVELQGRAGRLSRNEQYLIAVVNMPAQPGRRKSKRAILVCRGKSARQVGEERSSRQILNNRRWAKCSHSIEQLLKHVLFIVKLINIRLLVVSCLVKE